MSWINHSPGTGQMFNVVILLNILRNEPYALLDAIGRTSSDILNEHPDIDGILPKGPYPPCLRMADKALLGGYPRYFYTNSTFRVMCVHTHKELFTENWQSSCCQLSCHCRPGIVDRISSGAAISCGCNLPYFLGYFKRSHYITEEYCKLKRVWKTAWRQPPVPAVTTN